MNMPGFSAEAALYESTTHYRGKGAAQAPEGQVQAAFTGPRGCFRTCVRECGDDDLCVQDCACICSGQAGKTCWPM